MPTTNLKLSKIVINPTYFKIILAMVLFSCSFNSVFSQNTISGTVIDSETKEPIAFASVFLRDSDDTILSFNTTNTDGYYSIEFIDTAKNSTIETSIISHISKKIKLPKESDSHKNYIQNFELDLRVSDLEEVFIATKKPIIVKNDTTFYRPNSFKDGTERVLEDLLKKLPGLTIAENGSIKFKGKQVTRVLLDNDNLFDVNYTIGTKNINPEIIQEIQAIEGYQENALLKDVKHSEDVALNLTLKKGETDVSGDLDLGLGIDNVYSLNGNALSVSKKIKGFALVNYNNVNKNMSPYRFDANTFDLSKIEESKQRAHNFTDATAFSASLPSKYTGSSNTFFGSLNALNKLSDKIALRLNLNHFRDKLRLNNATKTLYNLDESDLTISNTYDLEKKPIVNVLDYELKVKPSLKSALNFKGKIDYTTLAIDALSTNNNSLFKEDKNSKDLFIKQQIEFTKKVTTESVFQVTGDFSKNDIPQYLNFNNITSINSTITAQDIRVKHQTIDVASKFLSKLKNGNYAIALGYYNHNNALTSTNSFDTISNLYNRNTTTIEDNSVYLDVEYVFKKNRWQFILENELLVSAIKIDNNAALFKTHKIINNPSATVNFSLSNAAVLYAKHSIVNKLPELNKIFSGRIKTDNRNLLSNQFNFNLIQNKNTSFGYRINDFYNLFQFNSYFNYSKVDYDYLNTLFIDDVNTLNISELQKLDNNNYRLGIDTEKYIDFIKSTLDLKTAYTINNYKNIINNTEIRENKNKSLNLQLEVRTGFKKDLNFANKVIFQNNSFSSKGYNSNQFTTFQNHFSVKYIKNRFYFTVDGKYFDPNLKTRNNSITFIDAAFNYQQKNEKIDYSLQVNNLLNKREFVELNSSDYSSTLQSQKLLERYFLFSVRFKL
ncbi:hypothetical protein ES677_00625 [Bizionia gelidisalsuginis]|uniref:TonB-dependent receptor n=1 Tax=Bizionia gelidisalsuginis TaxID=291188 RepID=A0ABY3MEA5_9FLAO|nr:TonB-dependent receptor [Bizionia gelidisalsuginis]TYC17912.1 hypothetical protein ES677_00625 [Bizionia gelidisalsuginis]